MGLKLTQGLPNWITEEQEKRDNQKEKKTENRKDHSEEKNDTAEMKTRPCVQVLRHKGVEMKIF
jgi:hypothetical protein